MEDLDKIREFFAKDRFATENGAVIEAIAKRKYYVFKSLQGR